MENGERKMLKAKPCYGHLGGTLGNRLFERLIELDWFEPDEESARGFRVTQTGKMNLEKLGVDIYSKQKAKGTESFQILTGMAVEFEDPDGNRLGLTDYKKG